MSFPIGIERQVELSRITYEELNAALEEEEKWMLPLLKGYGLGFLTRKGDLVVFVPKKDE